jgi:hypothetical protein
MLLEAVLDDTDKNNYLQIKRQRTRRKLTGIVAILTKPCYEDIIHN